MIEHTTRNEYQPNYVSPPGETLYELLDDLGMSQAELAKRTGRPKKTINEIIQGKTAITPETALQFERVLGAPAGFWIRREQNYREYLARKEDDERLKKHLDWMKDMPVAEMIAKKWIKKLADKVEQLKEVLQFFGISSPEQWSPLWEQPTAFRQSKAFEANPKAVAAWLRKGQIEAQAIDCAPYDSDRFKDYLAKIRELTIDNPESFIPKLQDLCAQVGVAVVFVPQLKNTRVSGATYWLDQKAVIQLSFRYKTNDHLWFTFFHEAGHILRHGKRDVFLEIDNEDSASQKETEADKFAAEQLISRDEWNRFMYSITPSRVSKASIRQFADKINIAPGIVVGRLQHENIIPYTHCNDLKVTLRWDNFN